MSSPVFREFSRSSWGRLERAVDLPEKMALEPGDIGIMVLVML